MAKKTFEVGRDSKTGRFIPVQEAQRRPNTTTVERVPNPGRGDTGRTGSGPKDDGWGGPKKPRK